MVKISPRIAVYYVNPDSKVFGDRFVKLSLKKFNASLTIPHTITRLWVKNIDHITIEDLKPLTEDFVIVILPSKSYYLSIKVHSGVTIITTSFYPANTSYAVDTRYPPLTIIRRVLLEGRPFSFTDGFYAKLDAAGRALLIASTVVFTSLDQMMELSRRILSFRRLPKKQKAVLRRILLHRRRMLTGGK